MKIPLSQRAFLGSNSKLVIGKRPKNLLLRRKVPPVPTAAHWGWGHLPVPAKIMILGVFCGLISITTPFWASVSTDTFGKANYGLWHFCRGEDCTSIHDNIIEGSSVPGLCVVRLVIDVAALLVCYADRTAGTEKAAAFASYSNRDSENMIFIL